MNLTRLLVELTVLTLAKLAYINQGLFSGFSIQQPVPFSRLALAFGVRRFTV